MSRTAEYSVGPVRSTYSTISSKAGRANKQSMNPGFKAVHGCDPPARRKKNGAESFCSENRKIAGSNRNSSGKSRSIARSTQRSHRDNDRSSSRNTRDESLRVIQGDKLVKPPSDEGSMASDSTSSTISTKGRNIPGKLYH